MGSPCLNPNTKEAANRPTPIKGATVKRLSNTNEISVAKDSSKSLIKVAISR